MLPPADRLIGAQLDRYVGDQLYWVLHAPRQTGKTTFIQSWARELNATGKVAACYVTVEYAQGLREVERAMPTICEAIRDGAAVGGLPVPDVTTHALGSLLRDILGNWFKVFKTDREPTSPASMLSKILGNWAALVAPKPLVIFFDEVDVLEGETMISFLRQLRGGFATRAPSVFPISIALVGMRDLRDYLVAAKDGVAPNPGSPFNIKTDSVVIGNFQREDIARLFAQRTEEIKQQITQEALDYVWKQSRGQPWIVNSLLMRATMRVLTRDSAETVTLEHVEEARKQMITARETHLEALGERLRDPRIKRVIQAILSGDSDAPLGRSERDVEFAIDLGLITWTSEEGFRIANPVYEEILMRYLNSPYHDSVPPPSQFRWQHPDGSLDMDSLLKEFQKFWRRYADTWEKQADYMEVFPHLLLMGFLQRLTNGGGHIERESSAGSERMDIFVEYGAKKFILEIKLLRDRNTVGGIEATGLKQIFSYRDKFDKTIPCYLIIFDRRSEGKKLPWEERISWRTEGEVTILGC
jgi:hypothetical protein